MREIEDDMEERKLSTCKVVKMSTTPIPQNEYQDGDLMCSTYENLEQLMTMEEAGEEIVV